MQTTLASPNPASRGAPAQAPDADDGAPLQFLRFTLGHESSAVRIDAVREILEVVPMTPLPLMPEFVRGVMNLRGAVVPVIDLGARVGHPPSSVHRRSCVVIVALPDPGDDEAGERATVHTLGVLVDGVNEVFECAAGELEPVPRLGTRIEPRYLRSMVHNRGSFVPELDLQAILDPRTLAQLIGAHGASH